VRNGERYVGQALDSLTRQTFSDFEVVVVDDGSTDGTVSAVAARRDPRVRLLRTSGLGIARALNLALDAAASELVARHDADDVSRPARFARQVAYLDEHPDVDVLATVCDFIDTEGRPHASAWVDGVRRQHDAATTPAALAALMPVTCCVAHGSIMARRAALRHANGYQEACVPAEDYDLWLRLLPTHRFAKLAEPLYAYRVHPGQSGAQQRQRQTGQALRAKLRWLRRAVPSLPAQPRLATSGHARGAAAYAEAAPDEGFAVVDPQADWDVLALTEIDDWPAALGRLGTRTLVGWPVFGNFIVNPECAGAGTCVASCT
jgi:hypothetical protein